MTGKTHPDLLYPSFAFARILWRLLFKPCWVFKSYLQLFGRGWPEKQWNAKHYRNYTLVAQVQAGVKVDLQVRNSTRRLSWVPWKNSFPLSSNCGCSLEADVFLHFRCHNFLSEWYDLYMSSRIFFCLPTFFFFREISENVRKYLLLDWRIGRLA